MTDENNIGLSRRRVLGGLGAVGIASAGAGLGTTAYFSDQQTFEGNTLTAGTLALNVEQKVVRVNQDGIGPDQLEYFSADDASGEAVVTEEIDITDAKPGDEYEFCWEVEIEGNPGFAKVCFDADEQTGYEAGNVSADDLYDVDDNDDMLTIGEAANATATLTLADETEVVIYENSLDGLFGALGSCIAVPAGEEEFCHQPEEAVELCVEIEIPTDVGNELQGAESTFAVDFHAEQCRHNDLESFLGEEAEAGVRTAVGEGFLTVEEEFAQSSMTARGRFGDGGGPQTWEVGIWESTQTDEDTNYTWQDGETVPFSFEYDGDADESTFDLDGSVVTAGGGAPQGRMGVQAKADDATIEVENLELVDDSGTSISLVGPDGVTASNDGSGRELRYLVASTSPALLADGFTLTGDVTVTLGADHDGTDESVAFDVVVE